MLISLHRWVSVQIVRWILHLVQIDTPRLCWGIVIWKSLQCTMFSFLIKYFYFLIILSASTFLFTITFITKVYVLTLICCFTYVYYLRLVFMFVFFYTSFYVSFLFLFLSSVTTFTVRLYSHSIGKYITLLFFLNLLENPVAALSWYVSILLSSTELQLLRHRYVTMMAVFH